MLIDSALFLFFFIQKNYENIILRECIFVLKELKIKWSLVKFYKMFSETDLIPVLISIFFFSFFLMRRLNKRLFSIESE